MTHFAPPMSDEPPMLTERELELTRKLEGATAELLKRDQRVRELTNELDEILELMGRAIVAINTVVERNATVTDIAAHLADIVSLTSPDNIWVKQAKELLK